MRPSTGSIKREYPHLTENWEVPQDDSRLMRRLKRRSIASEMMEQNYSANAKRKKVGSCGHEAVKNVENSGHVLVEEVDEDYGFFLDKVDFHVDVVSDNNIIASDVDVNTCRDSDNDGDTDAQYKSRMGPSKGTIKHEYSHLTENWEVFQYDSRLMRRLKRRFIASEIMERGYSSNAKRKNVGCFGDEVVKNAENSGNVLEEEVDLDKADFHVDVIGDDNIIASDIDVNTSHDSDNDGETDAQYKMLLENLREDDKSYILKVFVDKQLFCVRYEGQEVRFHDLVNSEVLGEGDDKDYQLFLNSSRLDGDSLICMPERNIIITYGASESDGEGSKIRQNLQVPFEVTELPNSRQALNDFHVAKKKRLNEVSSDDVDEDWKIYLNLEARRKSEAKSAVVRQNLQVSNEATEHPNAGQASDDYHVVKNNCPNEVLSDVDEDWQMYLNSKARRKSEAKCLAVRQNLQVSNEATELSDVGQASDVHHVVKNKHPSEVLGDVDEDWHIYLNSEARRKSEAKSAAVRQNLQVSSKATELLNARQDLSASQRSHLAKHKCNTKVLCNSMDENYQLFLKSLRTDGNNLIYMPENGVAVVYGEECDQSSTDSEPMILHPSQHYEDRPSIFSESYRSFCLADERNHKDSLYRKGLMEELERPYNQKELDKLLQVASHERLKELHREMRHGVTKDRPKGGDDNKTSYLKMHGGLQNSINQVKEPHKVLFLLRGFFYWLQHVPQGGAFRPWLDASCLKMLQKL
ncbi:hypothetical protein QN277_019155 [Acacia crassicarpa]|uniref:Uncharacterized protein n=1 Tax=Acacia crassicarpa TaxID=499986 RepID=A0AAE1JST2_9FABA|nr:hypothetical protein QN277_019155 [Acacia crassicarpa]